MENKTQQTNPIEIVFDMKAIEHCYNENMENIRLIIR